MVAFQTPPPPPPPPPRSKTMSTLSKEDYLKRYLSGGSTDTKEKKKKKKDKKVARAPVRMRIIDNDADVPSAAMETAKDVSTIIWSRPIIRRLRKSEVPEPTPSPAKLGRLRTLKFVILRPTKHRLLLGSRSEIGGSATLVKTELRIRVMFPQMNS